MEKKIVTVFRISYSVEIDGHFAAKTEDFKGVASKLFTDLCGQGNTMEVLRKKNKQINGIRVKDPQGETLRSVTWYETEREKK